jgi:2-iminobutanoate/2-iminopropanoate deaminase
MPAQIVKSPNAPQPKGPYSQGLVAGGFLFVSAQGPFDSKTGKIAGSSIESQTRQTLDNIKAIIEAAGLTMRNLVRVSVFLKNASDFQKMNEVYKAYFPQDPPTRTTLETGIPIPDVLVSMDAIAHT